MEINTPLLQILDNFNNSDTLEISYNQKNHSVNNRQADFNSSRHFDLSSSSPTYHHPDLAAPNSSLRPVHAEVCVSPYNCEEFSIIESCVVEFLRHLGPRHVPTVLESPY
ncbi:unnamed protein product, partial [Trichobilharzia regenti]